MKTITATVTLRGFVRIRRMLRAEIQTVLRERVEAANDEDAILRVLAVGGSVPDEIQLSTNKRINVAEDELSSLGALHRSLVGDEAHERWYHGEIIEISR